MQFFCDLKMPVALKSLNWSAQLSGWEDSNCMSSGFVFNIFIGV